MHDHHDHGHGHHHHHHANPADIGSKAFIAGIVLNGAYVVAQAIAGFATNSVALLSDAGHNLGDVAGLALSLIALKLAKVKPTSTFTYGYKKSTILAALVNAVILLLAVGVLGYESISRLLSHPEPVQGATVAWVAALGIGVNGFSAFFFFRSKDKELNNKAAYLHLLSDALVSLGVVVAGVVIAFTHWYWLDSVVSVAVLLAILVSTWSLLTSSLRLSMDAVPDNINVDEIEAVIKKVKGVEDIHHMHIWAMSTTENALTSHVVLNSELDFDKKMQVVHNIKHTLEHHSITHATIELESAEAPCHDADC